MNRATAMTPMTGRAAMKRILMGVGDDALS
jgi:hypothetical protein